MLSIVHDINSSFDCDSNIDVRGVFLDILKAFDKVWHDGIMLEWETYGVKGKLRACYQSLVLDDTSQDELNYDLQKVGHGAFQWKIQCKPDPKKNKHKKRFFSKKTESNNFLPLTFNKTEVRTCQSQKQLGFILDERLNSTEHINSKIGKWNCLLLFQEMHY